METKREMEKKGLMMGTLLQFGNKQTRWFTDSKCEKLKSNTHSAPSPVCSRDAPQATLIQQQLVHLGTVTPFMCFVCPTQNCATRPCSGCGLESAQVYNRAAIAVFSLSVCEHTFDLYSRIYTTTGPPIRVNTPYSSLCTKLICWGMVRPAHCFGL